MEKAPGEEVQELISGRQLTEEWEKKQFIKGKGGMLAVDPTRCDIASPGFSTQVEDHVVTLVFTPPSPAPHRMVVLSQNPCSGSVKAAIDRCSAGGPNGDQLRDHGVVVRRNDVPRIGAHHDEFAMGEVDHAHHAEDHCEAARGQHE